MLVPNTRGPLFTISPLAHSMGLVNDVSTPQVPPYPEQIGHTTSFWKAGLQGLGGCKDYGDSCSCGCKGMGNPQGLYETFNALSPTTILVGLGALLLLIEYKAWR